MCVTLRATARTCALRRLAAAAGRRAAFVAVVRRRTALARLTAFASHLLPPKGVTGFALLCRALQNQTEASPMPFGKYREIQRFACVSLQALHVRTRRLKIFPVAPGNSYKGCEPDRTARTLRETPYEYSAHKTHVCTAKKNANKFDIRFLENVSEKKGDADKSASPCCSRM